MHDLIREFSTFPLFEGLPENSMLPFVKMADMVTFGRGVRIFDDAEPADTVYLLRTGIVAIHVFSIVPAYDITLSRLYAGDVLGEFALVEGPLRSAAATCIEEVEAIAIPVADLLAHLDENPVTGYLVMKNLGRLVAGRVKSMNRRMLNLTRSSLF